MHNTMLFKPSLHTLHELRSTEAVLCQGRHHSEKVMFQEKALWLKVTEANPFSKLS